MAECVFCKIVVGELPAEIVLKTKNLIVFESIDPAADYHYLITSKQHIKEFIELKDAELFNEMRVTAQKIIKKYKFSGAYKLIFNGGKYPGVKHVHWHVLGGKMDKLLHEKI